MTITIEEMSIVISPMYAPVASGKNPKNSPKIPRFGMGHLQVVSNSQNTIVGGVSVTRVGGAYNNTTDNSPFKHSIVLENPNFILNDFATKFDRRNKRNRQIMKTLKMMQLLNNEDLIVTVYFQHMTQTSK